MPFTIRPLTEADAVVLGPLHNHLWRVTYAGLLPQVVLDARDDLESTRRWAERGRAHELTGASVEGCTTWVAHDLEGNPFAWAGAGPARDVDAPAPTELWALYVAPERQGTGVAAALTDHALGDVPAYLWVLDGNERAVAFYRTAGFALDGATKPFGEAGSIERRMVRP